MKIVGQTPTIDTAIYASRDAVGGLLTFDLGAGYGCKEVKLKRVDLLDDAGTPASADINLNLFTDSTMAKVDQAAFTVTRADFVAGKYLGSVNLATYVATDVGTNAAALMAIQNNLDRIVPLQHGKLYGQLSLNAGTPTFSAASQLSIVLTLSDMLSL